MNEAFLNTESVSRRKFISTSGKVLGGAGAATLVGPASSIASEGWPVGLHQITQSGDTILFQGDSITDAGRSREQAGLVNDQRALGSGYAWLASAELLVDHPKSDFKIYNRGISGNKVFQLADRWQQDCLDLKPNLLSILIGVNDIWHTLNG